MRGHIRTRKRKDGKRYVIVYDVGFKAQPDGSLKRLPEVGKCNPEYPQGRREAIGAAPWATAFQ